MDASRVYLEAAKAEAQRRGQAERVRYQHGNFTELAEGIEAADIVTLDRVICCYPDMEKLVSLSAGRARKVYGVVYPRDTWWIRLGLGVGNFFMRLRGSAFRGFVHPTEKVEALLEKMGFKRKSYRRTVIWQVVVYTR